MARLLEKHGATLDNIDKVVTYVTRYSLFLRCRQMPCRGVRGRDPTCRHVSRHKRARMARNAHRGRRDRQHAEIVCSVKCCRVTEIADCGSLSCRCPKYRQLLRGKCWCA